MGKLRAALLGGAFAAAALAIGAGPATAQTPDNVLVVADRIDDITTLDPAEIFEFSGTDWANNVYDTLVALDPADLGPLKPGLAESWTIGEDGKTYTFKIREGVKFHSGNPVTAADAAFSLRRVIKLDKTPSFILSQFGWTPDTVDEMVKATGPYTLRITVDKPYAPSLLLNCLTAPVASIVDSKLALENEADGDFGYGWLRTHSAGSGAYKLQGWTANENYILARNEGYWRGEPAMQRVIVRHVAEPQAQRLLLERGDVDVARNLSPDDIKAVREIAGLKVEEDLKGRIWYFALNQKNPILGDPKVREAFKWLTPYEAIRENILPGQAVVNQGFVPLTFLGEYKQVPYSEDLEKAKALLAEAGYPEGFEITMNVRNVSERMAVAQALQAAFAKAGIAMEIVPGTGKQTLGVYRAREHDIYLGTWGPDYPDPHTNADTFAHNPDNADEAKLTGKLAWRNAWDIPEMTAATEAALFMRDSQARAKAYRDIQAEFQKTSPFVMLYQQNVQTAMQEKVEGLVTGSAITEVFYWTVTKGAS